MRLSARNQLQGKVLEVKRGQINAKVSIEIEGGQVLTSIISLEAADELELVPGSDVTAIIKSSSIMLMS